MGLIYIGDQHGLEGVPNVPARDLTAGEVERYGGEAALLTLADGKLYERPAPVEDKESDE